MYRLCKALFVTFLGARCEELARLRAPRGKPAALDSEEVGRGTEWEEDEDEDADAPRGETGRP